MKTSKKKAPIIQDDNLHTYSHDDDGIDIVREIDGQPLDIYRHLHLFFKPSELRVVSKVEDCEWSICTYSWRVIRLAWWSLRPANQEPKRHILSRTPFVSFYLSLASVILHYPATNKKKQREYVSRGRERGRQGGGGGWNWNASITVAVYIDRKYLRISSHQHTSIHACSDVGVHSTHTFVGEKQLEASGHQPRWSVGKKEPNPED
jgi:hypothetical protein